MAVSLAISSCSSFKASALSSCSSMIRTPHLLWREVAHANSEAYRRRACRRLHVQCVGWDPEGILGSPQGGHIARRKLEKLLQTEGDQKAALEREAALERDRRRAAREARILPKTNEELVEFFMQTEAQEIEFEIARCRLWLNKEFFSFLQQEVSTLRFSLDQSKEVEDRLAELEVLQKVLIEGTEAYDKLATDLVGAKERLAKILTSKDKRETLLQMVAANELDRSLLALLDQNIGSAYEAGQDQAAKYMEKIRGAVLKYITF